MNTRTVPPVRWIFFAALALFLVSGPVLQPPKALAQNETDGEPSPAEEVSIPTPPAAAEDELKAALDSLEQKRAQLDEERAQLEKAREQLEALREEIETKIEEFGKIREQVAADLDRIEKKESEQARLARQAEEAKLKRLVKVYTNMKPKAAAAIVDKLDIDVARKLFSRMKGEQAGQILTYVDQERAATISEHLAKEKVMQ